MILSVVIPVYNGEDFIQKSYESIINQDISDFEIIYVNNNSSDNSRKKIVQLSENDSRIKLLDQKKQGAAAARNMGIANAQGDYVYIFDVDDEIYPDALNKMISALSKHADRDAVFGRMIKSYKGIDETIKPDDDTDEIILKDKPYWGLYWFQNLKDVVGPPAFLYRRSVFNKIGVYNEQIKNTEDTAFDIKLGMLCDVIFLDTYVYLYFKHASSTIEMAKREENITALHWSRFVKSHLPFYLENDVPLKYKELLYGYLFKTTGKRICETSGLSNRQQLLKEIKTEISPVKFPLVLRIALWKMTLFPFSLFLKIYLYYLVPFVLKNRLEQL